jgi:hypothetical protein
MTIAVAKHQSPKVRASIRSAARRDAPAPVAAGGETKLAPPDRLQQSPSEPANFETFRDKSSVSSGAKSFCIVVICLLNCQKFTCNSKLPYLFWMALKEKVSRNPRNFHA